MADGFSTNQAGLSSPPENGYAITPADGSDVTTVTRGLIVGVSGDVKVDFVGTGTAVVLPALAAGVVHPFRVSRVYSTDTTATSIVGLY